MSHPDDDATEPQVPATPPHQPLYAPPPAPAAATPPPPPPPPTPPAATPPYAPAPPPAIPPRAATRQQRESRRTALTALAVACFLVAAALVGYSMGADKGGGSTAAVGSLPSSQQQIPGFSDGSSSGSTGSTSNGQQSSIDVDSIAEKVSPSIVNLTSSLDQGEAAGTGIVVSSSGLVITNNHVIAYSNDLQAEIGGDGDYHAAKVLGYDIEDDVALVQIEDVSGLTAASLGNSSDLQVGDAIVALGNAGGKGGDPSVVSGTVTALDQQITAADQDGSNAESLDNLIQIDANIQPGDSGGPLVDADGDVVGMNAAASSGNGGFGVGGQSANEGYAIPVEDAMQIAQVIRSGDGTDTIHVGAHRAVLGVSVEDTGYGDPFGGNGDVGGTGQGSSTGNGAAVGDVQSDSAADSAGIEAGDTIVGLDGSTVSSARELTHSLVKYSPGDKISIEWIDSSGDSHTATLELGSGSPA
jgi:S1-C subfamily serine protease